MARQDDEIDRASAGTNQGGRCGDAEMPRCMSECLFCGEDGWKETHSFDAEGRIQLDYACIGGYHVLARHINALHARQFSCIGSGTQSLKLGTAYMHQL